MSHEHRRDRNVRGFIFEESVFNNPNDVLYGQIDLKLAREAMKVVTDHYPAYRWNVEATHARGMVFIRLPGLSREFVHIRIMDLRADPGMAIVKRLAGEMLERWRLSRGKDAKEGDYDAAIATHTGPARTPARIPA